VRRYDPAIALSTAIVLNLNGADYRGAERYDATELGIVIAASLAVDLAEKRQAVALATNGWDPLPSSGATQTPGEATGTVETPCPIPGTVLCPGLPLRKGQGHLMSLLDLLARVEVHREGTCMPFAELLGRKSLGLPWGSTAVAVTARETDGLMDALLALRRRGLQVVLICTCAERLFPVTAQRAAQIGVRAVQICSERDLAGALS
jgi:hypothetical protein